MLTRLDTHLCLRFSVSLVGKEDDFALDIAAVESWMLLSESDKGVCVLENWLCVSVLIVYMFFAERHTYLVASISQVDIACDSSGRFTADDARFTAFLVRSFLTCGYGCWCGFLECTAHCFCLVYLKNSSSRRCRLTCMKRCFLQKSKMRFSSGSLPSLNSPLKPSLPVMTRISKDPSMASIW